MCNLLDNFVCDPMRVTVSEKGLSVKESPFFVSINFLSATGGYKYGTGG